MDKMQESRISEIVSALADGQLVGDEFAQGVALTAADPVAREAWHTYHLIGEVLRTGECTPGAAPAAFIEKLQQRLREESGAGAAQPVAAAARVAQPAANDFTWKLVAGFASFAAVAAIGWSVAGFGSKQGEPQIAAAKPAASALPPGTVLAGTERGMMVRDPKLDEFLAAHRQLGGTPALMPAGFLRNATYEAAGR